MAAALHALDEKPLYPLGGLIASGMGNKLRSKRNVDPHAKGEHSLVPSEEKDAIMFKPGTVETDQFADAWLPM